AAPKGDLPACTVGRGWRTPEILTRRKRTVVARTLGAEERDSAADAGPDGVRWCEATSNARREGSVGREAVALVTPAQIEHEAPVRNPFVLCKQRVLRLCEIENTRSVEIEQLVARSVCAQNADRRTAVCACVRSVTQVHSGLQRMRAVPLLRFEVK